MSGGDSGKGERGYSRNSEKGRKHREEEEHRRQEEEQKRQEEERKKREEERIRQEEERKQREEEERKREEAAEQASIKDAEKSLRAIERFRKDVEFYYTHNYDGTYEEWYLYNNTDFSGRNELLRMLDKLESGIKNTREQGIYHDYNERFHFVYEFDRDTSLRKIFWGFDSESKHFHMNDSLDIHNISIAGKEIPKFFNYFRKHFYSFGNVVKKEKENAKKLKKKK